MRPIHSVIFLFLFVITSCKLDNYEAPNGAVYGRLIDKITNESFQTQQPNGYNVLLFEKGGSPNIPFVITGKPDGSFENSHIFKNEYKMFVTEGAFFPLDTVVVNIGERTQVDFEVTPFLAMTHVAVTSASGKITSTYNIERDRVEGKILERRTLVSEIPTVNNVVFDHQQVVNLSSVPDEDILTDTFVDEIEGLVSGKKYYVRVAARVQSSLGRFNYSKVFEVTIP